MMNKTRVLNVRVVGFSAPEKQMLNSIFLLSVAPARQIGYKLWNSESGTAPDMYLLDGDSDSAVASWQAAFSNTSDRTLVVGAKNTDLGVASAARPLGLKVVGAMDRLAIAIGNANKLATEGAALDVSAPTSAGTLPTSPAATTGNGIPSGINISETAPASPAKQSTSLPRVAASAPAPAMSASLNTSLHSLSLNGLSANAISPNAQTMSATSAAALPPAHAGTLPTAMTAAAPAATVLPNVTLQPNVTIDKVLERSLGEKPVTEKAVDKILSEKPAVEKSVEKMVEKLAEKPAVSAASLMASGVTPLTPAALSAVVSTTATRTNLRVVPSISPLAASLPAATSTHARIADAPMTPPAVARLAEAPMMAPAVTPSVAAPPAPPVAQAAAPAPVAAAPAPVPSPVMPSFVPTPRHEEQVFRVLAVDDSPLMRTFLQNKLSPYGISPDFASSGEEALFKISKQHFDMIFLDVMLPGMDGYDVCKMIKKNKDNHLMKVVMLTSKDRTFDKIRGTMAGCDGYLTKPVDELKLRAIIERHTVTRK
jgi:two-component system cell cycle response regulator